MQFQWHPARCARSIWLQSLTADKSTVCCMDLVVAKTVVFLREWFVPSLYFSLLLSSVLLVRSTLVIQWFSNFWLHNRFQFVLLPLLVRLTLKKFIQQNVNQIYGCSRYFKKFSQQCYVGRKSFYSGSSAISKQHLKRKNKFNILIHFVVLLLI